MGVASINPILACIPLVLKLFKVTFLGILGIFLCSCKGAKCLKQLLTKAWLINALNQLGQGLEHPGVVEGDSPSQDSLYLCHHGGKHSFLCTWECSGGRSRRFVCGLQPCQCSGSSTVLNTSVHVYAQLFPSQPWPRTDLHR